MAVYTDVSRIINKDDIMLQWTVFSAAPHRMMFFGGMVQILLTLMFWLIELFCRYIFSIALPSVIPSTWAHAFLLIFATIPFFIFGFLMTTYPRWMGGEIIPKKTYSLAFKLLFAGSLLFYLGLFTHKLLLMLAVALLLAGWIVAVYALWTVYLNAPSQNKKYEKVLNVSLLIAILSIISYLLWIPTQIDLLLLFTLKAGIWLFLVPILFAVCHRMLPFFSSSALANYPVRQPEWSLPVVSVLTTGHFLLEMAGQNGWLWLVDMPLLGVAAYHSVIWQFWRSLPVRLLAVLHLAFLWLSVALALYSVQSLLYLFTGDIWLGKAPLHALSIGFMTSLLVGMVSRVSLGHSGRALVADDLTWFCFWGVSGIAVLRILAEITFLNQLISLNLLAALLWLKVFGVWTWRYLPFMVLPRVDGREG
jgi:uncharacterized protein involved in response to NO